MKTVLLNIKTGLLILGTLLLGFAISFVMMFYMLAFSTSEEYLSLVSKSFKYNQSYKIDKKVNQMILFRTYLKNNFDSPAKLNLIKSTFEDSNLTLGLMMVGKDREVALGDRSLKFSYDYLSRKDTGGKWVFENYRSNYYMVNIAKKDENFFIVYQNIKSLVKPSFDQKIRMDSLYITNSQHTTLLISDKNVTEIKEAPPKKIITYRTYLQFHVKDWVETLNDEFLINYSLNYTILNYQIFIVFGVFGFFLIITFLIYLFGMERHIKQILKELIVKINDFSLGKSKDIKILGYGKGVIGDVIREFDKLGRDISQKDKEIAEKTEKLASKSAYLTKKMTELKELKDIIIRSLNVNDIQNMMQELAKTLRNVFSAKGVTLVRIVDGKEMKFYSSFREDAKVDRNLNNFISRIVGIIVTSDSSSVSEKYIVEKVVYSTTAYPVRVQRRLLGYLIIFKESELKEEEIDVIDTFISQVGVIFENLRLYEEEKTKEMLETEFSDAKVIQDILINTGEEKRQAMGVETYYLPAVNIGGDWFEALKVSEDKYLYMIADVTGHGAASALITTIFSTYFVALSALHGQKIFDNNEVSVLISVLNNVFMNLTNGVKNATFAIALYDKFDMTLDYISAGHNASYLYDSVKDKIVTLQVKNKRLGDNQNTIYKNKRFKVSRGDVLFMYTDGLIENNMFNGKEYSKKRLQNLLKNDLIKNDKKNFKDILARDIECNVDKKKLNDDVTFLVAKL